MKNRIAILQLIIVLLLAGCATSPLYDSQKQVMEQPDSNTSDVPVNEIKVSVLTKNISSWDGNILPHYPGGQPEITILKIKIPPGVSLPLHKHPVINAGVLLKGELTVVTEDKKTLFLRQGDPIVEVVDKWHYGKNEGNEPAEIIVFYVGTQGSPISIKAASKN